MSVIQVGLVDMTGKIDAELVQSAAVALNLQVTRDLPQFWPLSATVMYLSNPKKIPVGVWPVQLVHSLPPGEGGFHLNKHKQPYSKVIASPTDNTWTIDASHEILEMLIDPWGNRMQSSVAIEIVGGKIEDGTGQYGYLVEACDPCEDNSYAYTINGIAVSDFITPHFYDPVTTSGTRYSFGGNINAPRQVLPGGYISFVDPIKDEWEQILWVDHSKPPELTVLGPAPKDKSLREWIDSMAPSKNATAAARKSKTTKAKALLKYSERRIKAVDAAAVARAKLYK
jgi:hypothetical protein